MHKMAYRTMTAGFTLIEVVITLFVMTMGLIGLTGLQAISIKNSLDNARRSQVTWIVAELVERIRSNPDGQSSGYETTIEARNCPSAPTPQCSDNSLGDSSVTCTPKQMAQFDVWEVFCSQAASDVMTSSTDLLQLKTLEIKCTGNCTTNSDFTVKINWSSQAVSSSKILSEKSRQNTKVQQIAMTVRP